ncbi:MAG TPA: hypothetical protein VGX28_12280 [Frankiaceae bacterium]|nr:hypothetical protein [Frankiaceae bacterium]
MVLAERARLELDRLELRGHSALGAARGTDRRIVDELGSDEPSRRIRHALLDDIDALCPYPACRRTRAEGLRLLLPDRLEYAALAELIARHAEEPLPLRARAEAVDGETLASQVREGGRSAARKVLASGLLSGRVAALAALERYGTRFVKLLAELPAEAGWLLAQVPWLNLADLPGFDVVRITAQHLKRLAGCHGWDGEPTLWPPAEPPSRCRLTAEGCERFVHGLDVEYERLRSAEPSGGDLAKHDLAAYNRAHAKLGTLRYAVAIARRHGLTGHGSLVSVRRRPLAAFTAIADDVPDWPAVAAWLRVAILRLADRPALLRQLLLLVCTGARPREVAHTWQGSFVSVGDGNHLAHVPRPLGKTGASALVLLQPLADALRLRPELWPATPPAVGRDPGAPLRAAVAEIDDYIAEHHPELTLPGAVLYRFRHALARAMDEALGEDELLLVMLLRHLGEQATLHYATVSTPDVEHAVADFWRAAGPPR